MSTAHGVLRVAGTRIVDDRGPLLLLRGFGLGLNSLRIPLNYRHFEDDDAPMVLKEEGFRLLDRVIETCARHGIYTILDLHALPAPPLEL